MRFLSDQDVYAVTVNLLRDNGFEVVTASELGLSRASDPKLLMTAQSEGRIFLTRDRDFGALVHVGGMPGGVIYLRMLPSTTHVVHDELLRVISTYNEQQLSRAFVVVEAGRHRFRVISS
jgi:predicted nuclease of predicted toxin-antitoxin system